GGGAKRGGEQGAGRAQTAALGAGRKGDGGGGAGRVPGSDGAGGGRQAAVSHAQGSVHAHRLSHPLRSVRVRASGHQPDHGARDGEPGLWLCAAGSLDARSRAAAAALRRDPLPARRARHHAASGARREPASLGPRAGRLGSFDARAQLFQVSARRRGALPRHGAGSSLL
ncbi:hypothetical protein H632_c5095p0, partial [Helicosporidium sp. ATCC 50920]